MGKLICSATDPQWHNERLKCVTGSSIAYLMGIPVPWNQTADTAEKLWAVLLEKYTTKATPWKESRSMWWGRESEECNIQLFCKAAFPPSSYCVEPTNEFWREGYIGSTIDAKLVLGGSTQLSDSSIATSARTYWRDNLIHPLQQQLGGGNTTGLIEAKQTKERNAKSWGKEPPPYYYSQCQAQMYVTGLPWVILFARIGGDDVRAHLITPDELFVEEMVERAEKFWSEVSLWHLSKQRVGG